MGMYNDLGGSIGAQTTHQAKTDIAILLDEKCSKYHDGYQTFKLQGMVPLQPDTPIATEQQIDLSKLLNEDAGFITNTITKAACVKYHLPRAVRREYPKKIIPPGTAFVVEFVGGDITKGVITRLILDKSANIELGDMNEVVK